MPRKKEEEEAEEDESADDDIGERCHDEDDQDESHESSAEEQEKPQDGKYLALLEKAKQSELRENMVAALGFYMDAFELDDSQKELRQKILYLRKKLASAVAAAPRPAPVKNVNKVKQLAPKKEPAAPAPAPAPVSSRPPQQDFDDVQLFDDDTSADKDDVKLFESDSVEGLASTMSGLVISSPSPKKDSSQGISLECVICCSAPKSAAFIPCGHVACCEECANSLQKKSKRSDCPICRAPIQSSIRIFIA